MYIITETSKSTGYVWYVILNVTSRVRSKDGTIVNNYSFSVTDEIEDATRFDDLEDAGHVLDYLSEEGYTNHTRNTYDIV